MKTIFFNIPAHGHINPSLSVVAELVKRGEQVICVNNEAYRAVHENIGARFHAYPENNGLEALMGNASGGNLQENALTFVRIAEQLLPDLIKLIETENPDYLIYDSLCGWGKQLAERFKLPSVATVSTFVITPASMAAIPPLDVVKMLFGVASRLPAYFQIARRTQQNFGVKGVGLLGALMSLAQLNIVYTSRQFQPSGETLGAEYVFVGPPLGERGQDLEFPFGKMEQRPSIYVSLGTINNNRPEFYRACIDAFADHKGTVVLSVGKNTDLKVLGAIPDNFIVRNFVPQLEVLQHIDLFITHGGMNSVQEGLYYGVPLIVVPQQAEQAMVARQVTAKGAGVVMDNTALTAAGLRTAAAKVLADANFKKQAAQLGENLRAAGGAVKAAESIMAFTQKGK